MSSVLYFDTPGEDEGAFQVVSTLQDENFVVEALFSAVEEGNLPGLEELFAMSSINPNLCNKHGEPILHIAAGLGHLELVKFLQSKGADIHSVDSHGDSALYWAARQGHDAVVRHLYEQGVSVATRNKSQETALHIAARYGHTTAVQLLCSYGSDVNARDDHEETALHIAVWHGFPSIVNFLCQYGASTTLRNKEEETAIHCASARGHVESLRCLLDAGADVTLTDKNGCTGLHLALRRHHIAVAQLLLTVGCPHDVVDKFGDAPIHIGVKEGLLPLVHALHVHGAKLDVPNKSGFPPLYLAAQHGHVEVVRYLCLAGCRVEQKSKDGILAEVAAQVAGHSHIADLLARLRNDEGKEAYAPQLAPSNQPPARVKLKVLGPSGGGKSTLLDSLKCGGYFTGWFRRSKSPSSSSVTGQRLGTAHSSKSSIDMSSDDGLSLSFDSHAFTRGIDMQQVHLSGVGEVALWEFSGHEAYRVAYTTFLHDPCLHLVVVSLLDPRELQAHQAAQWLELLQAALHCVGPLGREGRSQKRAHVALVATHADEAESWDLLEAVRALCGDLPGLELHDTVFTVDARQATALKPLKQYLAGVRTALLQDVPRSSPFLDAVITNLATWRRGAHNFPVVSYGQFAELVRNQVNPLAGDQHLSQLVISLQILGEVVFLRGVTADDDLVVLSPRWLGTDVLGWLLTAGGGSVAELQSAFPECDALDLLQVLEALGLCAPAEDVEFEFPCFLPTPPPLPCPTGALAGSRLMFGSAQLMASIFPHIQTWLRRAAADRPQWKLIQYQNSSHLTVAQSVGLQAEVSMEPNWVDICVRGGEGPQSFYLLHELQSVVEQCVGEMWPGILLEHRPLVERGGQVEPVAGVLEALHSQGLGGQVGDIPLSQLVLPGCKGVPQGAVLGPDLPTSQLPLPLVQRLAAVLDPAEPIGRDWCVLAVLLGLTDLLPRLDPGEDPATSPLSRVLVEWGNQPSSSIAKLLEALKSLGRPDATEIIHRFAPWVKVVIPCEDDTPSNLSR